MRHEILYFSSDAMTSIIDEIEQGIEFVSADTGNGEAFLSRETGKIYFRSDYVDKDAPLPEDLDDEIKYIALPDKRELDLGSRLVFRFIEHCAPDKVDEVSAIFRKRGAYARFKYWLDRYNLLNDWYQYQNNATTEAIKAWCEENGVKLINTGCHRK